MADKSGQPIWSGFSNEANEDIGVVGSDSVKPQSQENCTGSKCMTACMAKLQQPCNIICITLSDVSPLVNFCPLVLLAIKQNTSKTPLTFILIATVVNLFCS